MHGDGCAFAERLEQLIAHLEDPGSRQRDHPRRLRDAHHAERLAAACLAVCEERPVVPLQQAFDEWLAHLLKNRRRLALHIVQEVVRVNIVLCLAFFGRRVGEADRSPAELHNWRLAHAQLCLAHWTAAHADLDVVRVATGLRRHAGLKGRGDLHTGHHLFHRALHVGLLSRRSRRSRLLSSQLGLRPLRRSRPGAWRATRSKGLARRRSFGRLGFQPVRWVGHVATGVLPVQQTSVEDWKSRPTVPLR